MDVKVVNYTPEPEKAVVAAARSCWSEKCVEKENVDEKTIRRILDKVVSSGHHSVLEHASFTFNVDGISRACSHQLVRHRMASYSQQSHRYVNLKEPQYVIPPKIEKNSDSEISAMYRNIIEETWKTYGRLIEAGVPKEDARYVLPNAATTSIVVTMNARELLLFFELRTCLRAQWEIRHLAEKMMHEVKQVAPILFSYAGAACITKKICPDEATDCPRYPKNKKTKEQ